MQGTLRIGSEVRITTRDGKIRELKVVDFTSENLIGELVTSTDIKDQNRQTIALDDISFVKVRKVDVVKSVTAGVATVAVVNLVAETLVVIKLLRAFW